MGHTLKEKIYIIWKEYLSYLYNKHIPYSRFACICWILYNWDIQDRVDTIWPAFYLLFIGILPNFSLLLQHDWVHSCSVTLHEKGRNVILLLKLNYLQQVSKICWPCLTFLKQSLRPDKFALIPQETLAQLGKCDEFGPEAILLFVFNTVSKSFSFKLMIL